MSGIEGVIISVETGEELDRFFGNIPIIEYTFKKSDSSEYLKYVIKLKGNLKDSLEKGIKGAFGEKCTDNERSILFYIGSLAYALNEEFSTLNKIYVNFLYENKLPYIELKIMKSGGYPQMSLEFIKEYKKDLMFTEQKKFSLLGTAVPKSSYMFPGLVSSFPEQKNSELVKKREQNLNKFLEEKINDPFRWTINEIFRLAYDVMGIEEDRRFLKDKI